MKKIICGYSQEAAMELGLDLKDLHIIRYIHDFIKLGYIYNNEIDGEIFYWIKSSFLLSEIPLLDIKSSDVLRRRLKKLTELKILDYKLVKDKGLFTFYKFGDNYKLLLVNNDKAPKKENKEIKKIVELISKSKKSEEIREIERINNIENKNEKNKVVEERFIENNKKSEENTLIENLKDEGQVINKYDEKNTYNNFNFENNPKKFYPKVGNLKERGDSIFKTADINLKVGTNNKQSNINKEKEYKKIYIKKICEEVIDFLNSEIDTSYKANSKQIVKLIKRLIELGFTVSDFKKVILNKKRCWKGTDYEIYLRPSTLFRESKFEEYLNEKEKINKGKNEVRSIYDIYKPFS